MPIKSSADAGSKPVAKMVAPECTLKEGGNVSYTISRERLSEEVPKTGMLSSLWTPQWGPESWSAGGWAKAVVGLSSASKPTSTLPPSVILWPQISGGTFCFPLCPVSGLLHHYPVQPHSLLLSDSCPFLWLVKGGSLLTFFFTPFLKLPPLSLWCQAGVHMLESHWST